MARGVECLPSKYKALSSSPSIAKKQTTAKCTTLNVP
jgi:hypothetical protein